MLVGVNLGAIMFEALQCMFYFVTIAVSFIYGTTICLLCGKNCTFDQTPEDRKQTLKGSLIAAVAIYTFCFVVFFNNFCEGCLSITVFALTSGVLLAAFVTSMSMPELRRDPSNR